MPVSMRESRGSTSRREASPETKSAANTQREQQSILKKEQSKGQSVEQVTFEQNITELDQNEQHVQESKVVAPPQEDTYNKDKGSSLTFTYKEGLVVQILPNGAV